MYFDEHPPPHFHAEYGEFEVLIDINTLAVFAGKLPPRALGLVMEWAASHQDELKVNWQKVENLQSLDKIAPLK